MNAGLEFKSTPRNQILQSFTAAYSAALFNFVRELSVFLIKPTRSCFRAMAGVLSEMACWQLSASRSGAYDVAPSLPAVGLDGDLELRLIFRGVRGPDT